MNWASVVSIFTIVDVWIPDEMFEEFWETDGVAAAYPVQRGQSDAPLQVCHSRTGLVAVCLLVEFGVEPREAIRRMRAARLGAMQPREKEDYLLNILWRLQT